MTEKRHRVHTFLVERARELRQPQTPAEQKLWAWLRNRQLEGYKFRRQHPIGCFIADFCCIERRLVVEVDGDTHADQEPYDLERTEWLNDQGYTVIRFTNREVMRQMAAVLDVILDACRKEPPSPPAPLPPYSGGEGSRSLAQGGESADHAAGRQE